MLGGYKPFNPPSACMTSSAGPDFNDPIWDTFSEAAKDFIVRLLQQDPVRACARVRVRAE